MAMLDFTPTGAVKAHPSSLHRGRRCTAAAGLVAVAVFGNIAQAQAILRDEARPCCWYPTGYHWSQALSQAQSLIAAGERILDISTWDPVSGHIRFCVVCNVGGMMNPGYSRPHGVDVAVDRATAIASANASIPPMFISAVAPFDLGGVTFFVALREELPAGCAWQWVPFTTISDINTWLSTNPGYQPYSVDTSVAGGTVHYHVMAMEGPGVRATTLRFAQPLANLPSPSQPGGDAVISVAMDSAATFTAIVQHGDPAYVTDYIAILPTAGAYVPGSINAGLERVFSFAHWHAPGAVTEFALVVSNAWPLNDIYDFPPTLPSPGYRGCANSLAPTTTMVVASSVPVAAPGATLTFTVAPRPPAALGLVILGLDRLNWIDLGSLGAPGCLLIPSLEVVSVGSSLGGLSQWQMLLPTGSGVRGARFYAQGGLVDLPANPLGITTSNAYMITIQ